MRSKKPMDRLTRDAIAVQKAGMSYGRYKALHPHTGEDEPVEHELPGNVREITCAFCGRKFWTDTRHANRLYCDDICQRNASNRRVAARKQGQEEEIRRCAVCGKEIDCYKGKLYCGLACREEANRIRNRERQRRRAAERAGA